MHHETARESLLFGAIVATILMLGWFVYEPALDSVFLFDDEPNLHQLEAVTDSESALMFTLSGAAGPLGRPLALATFLPQVDAWNDENAAAFLIINVLIHLFNGLLVYHLFLRLARTQKATSPNDQWVAIGGMALWLFMPLLASSSLMIVQRMTTLSGTFMLIGLNAYLAARSRIGMSPALALTGMSTALVAATSLAVLTKENGALLPTLVLMLEATLLSQPSGVRVAHWRAWQTTFLVAPTLVILLFVASKLQYADFLVERRGYDGIDRLVTEARILFEYLYNSFIPNPEKLGPFHDDRRISVTLAAPSTLVPVAGWLTAISLALMFRRRYPVAAFAILWYLAGHALESTTLPLYLYFEHRNYMPLLGPVFAVASLCCAVNLRYRKIARFALPLYIIVNAGVLYSVTSLWGMPLNAAAYWHHNAPASVAAASHLAIQQSRYMALAVGILTLREFALRNPEHAYLRLPELSLSCKVARGADHSETVQYLSDTLPTVRFSHSVGSMLDSLMLTIATTDCNGVDLDVGRKLADTLMSNPRYRKSPRFGSYYHQLLAQIAWDSGDPEAATTNLEQARNLLSTDQLHRQFVGILAAQNRFDEAREYLAVAEGELPSHLLRNYAGRLRLRSLGRHIDTLEAQAGEQVPNAGRMDH